VRHIGKQLVDPAVGTDLDARQPAEAPREAELIARVGDVTEPRLCVRIDQRGGVDVRVLHRDQLAERIAALLEHVGVNEARVVVEREVVGECRRRRCEHVPLGVRLEANERALAESRE